MLTRVHGMIVGFACVASVAVAASLAACARASQAGSMRVTVDLNSVRQIMDGFGTSERLFSDPHLSNAPKTSVPAGVQREILRLLYGRLGLTRVRVVLDPGIEATRGGPFNFSVKLGEDQIPFIRQAEDAGLKTFFPGPVYLEDWMTPEDVGPYVDYAMAVLRFWRSKGLEPPLYAPLNEPKIARNFPPQWMHDVVVQLGRRLKQNGFKTKLVIPDDENPVDALRRAVAVLSDPEARKYVAAIAYHIYKGSERDWVPLKELGARYGLPVWMTEYINEDEWGDWPAAFDWAVTINDLITVGGVSAVDYLWGFFGDWAGGGGAYIGIKFDHGTYQSYTLRPLYYLTGQWSRYVRPGYRRIEASPARGPVLTTAFRGPKRIVIVSLNTSSEPQTVIYALKGGKAGKKVAAVRTSATEGWNILPKLRVRSGAFTARLPARSVTTLIVPLV